MNADNVTPFLFEGEITVRVLERDGVLWFVAADVCRALGLTNPAETVRSLDDDEKDISSADTLGGVQEMVVVSESGLYTLIFKSRKPNAIHFRKWVTAVVLPAIRTTGRYQAAPEPWKPALPEVIKLRMVMEARQVFGTRAAGEMWFRLGLPTVPMMHLPPHQPDLFMIWNKPAGVASA